MTKKEYMKPTMQTVELKQCTMILAGSMDEYGMNKSLQDDEVEEAWSRKRNGVWDDDEEW